MGIEAAVAAALLALALWPLLRLGGRARWAALVLAIAGAGAASAYVSLRTGIDESDVANRPVSTEHSGYLSSRACRQCHPREYATWEVSYHRKMTQVATPDSVAAPVDGVDLALGGRSYHIEVVDDEIWVDIEDAKTGEKLRRQIVLSTGSHHFQAYWFSLGAGRKLGLFEWAYQIAEERWIPMDALGITPPGTQQATLDGKGRWNRNCNRCHSTGPKPRVVDMERMDTRVGEFGIACEACHGPGEQHVEINRDPVRRYRLHLTGEPDPSILMPPLLDHERSSYVCGQCHSKSAFHTPEDQKRWAWHGPDFRPGDDLIETRRLITTNKDPALPEVQRFWPDGMVRVNGRELNSQIENPCYEAGEMSCLSCHSMHMAHDDESTPEAWADDQLLPRMRSGYACTQCHESFEDGAALVAHTHHAADSPGSNCLNCHMANTAYGLQKATRSHEIEHPSVATEIATGRPNACNLCHLDRSLGWTADTLSAWYGIPAPELSEQQREIAASVVWLLSGDAGVRGLAAWHTSWAPARRTSGTRWMAPYLGQLLADPYVAVRSMAWKSLRTLEGFQDFDYDYIANRKTQRESTHRALRRWQRITPPSELEGLDALLMNPETGLRLSAFNAFVRERDDTPVFLAE